MVPLRSPFSRIAPQRVATPLPSSVHTALFDAAAPMPYFLTSAFLTEIGRAMNRSAVSGFPSAVVKFVAAANDEA